MEISEDGKHPLVTSGSNGEEEDLGVAQSLGLQTDMRPRRPQRRLATVYDAVAGRVSYHALRDKESDRQAPPTETPRITKHPTGGDITFAPEEVLFKRRDAPERYAEHDIYHSHERDLPRSGRGVLPESDLLKAVHGYSSKFYDALASSRPQPDGRSVDFRSMDETALLAFGILLEEAGRDVLGRRGDLVFTEGTEDAEGSSGNEVAQRNPQAIGHQEVGSWRRANSGPKRRKVIKNEEE